MVKVTWKIYGRTHKERVFDDYAAARGFFYGYILKASYITSGELKVL